MWQRFVGNGGAKPIGATGDLFEHTQALLVEAFDHIAHGLVVAPKLLGNGSGVFLAR